MKINVKKGNLFELDEKEYYFVHCISSDCAMGAGIAIEFQKRFRLRSKLLSEWSVSERKHPCCIFTNRVFNLITKEKYWNKPMYESLRQTIIEMLEIITDDESIVKLAMPKIASGLDRLQWSKVLEILKEEVENWESQTKRELEIEVRYL